MPKFEDDFLRLPLIRRRLDAEGDGDPWWAVSTKANRDHVYANSAVVCVPAPEQVILARDLIAKLNRLIDHDGRWLAIAVLPRMGFNETVLGKPPVYDELRMIWIDADGDPQFTYEIEWHLHLRSRATENDWLGGAEEAWQTWHLHMRDTLEPGRQGALYHRAQGETAPSER